MDVRKLISFGKGSYILSIPKNWIEKNNLRKGDLISVDDNGHELTLSINQSEKKIDVKEIDINAKNKNIELLKVEIVSSYLNGYDTINIIFDSSGKEISKIKDIMRDLSGLEIMEQTSSRIAAKNLININDISIKHIIRRMDVITRAMIDDAILCYSGQSHYDSIHNRDFDVNRLYFLSYRVIKNAMKNPRIAKSLGTDPWELHSDTLIILRLEKIADRQKRIARFVGIANLDRVTFTEVSVLHTTIAEAYNNVMKAYYNRDKQIAFEIEVTNKDRINQCDKFLERFTERNCKGKKTNVNHVAVVQIIENLKATATSIRNIARTVLCYE